MLVLMNLLKCGYIEDWYAGELWKENIKISGDLYFSLKNSAILIFPLLTDTDSLTQAMNLRTCIR
jgi:hypothetical protein